MKSPNSVDELVGAQVRLRRIASGMSRQTLADALGSTAQQVEQWEAGTNRVGSARLLELTKILGVNAGFFFADSRPNELRCEIGSKRTLGSRPILVSTSSLEALRMTGAFAGVKHHVLRKVVIELVETMAGIKAESEPIS